MNEFECRACGWKGFPAFELSMAGKMLAQCGKCGTNDPSVTPADLNRGIGSVKNDAGKVETFDVRPDPSAVVHSAARMTERPSRMAPPSRPVQAYDPGDVIAQIRARRDFLEGEVARLEACKLELRKLNKMLSAARREEARTQVAAIEPLGEH